MRRTVENFKSFILTILIISSLVLTGSLWFDNYQGLSLHALAWPPNIAQRFSSNENSLIVYDNIILPYKVTVINPDGNKWIYYETNSMNLNAWNLIKERLNLITSETEIITGKIKEWDALIDRKSIILDFGGTIEYDILRLVVPNLTKESNAFNNIEKIALTKSLEGNTIYILQNDGNNKFLYKVLLKGEDTEIENFMKNCENIKADARYVKLPEVGTTSFFNGKEVISQSSVLFPVSNSHNRRELVQRLKVNSHFNMEDEYEINRFVIDVFNNSDFAKFVTTDESNIFINDDKSSIKFEKDGVVEYINNSKLSGEIVSAVKNFNEAMSFINNMRIYDNVYLLSAEEENGLYTFKFSVAFDGIPLGMLTPVIDEDSHTIIKIQVKEGSIRYFKGKLLDVEIVNNGEYISRFTHNILDEVLKNVEANEKVNISSVELIYAVDKNGTYYPNWITKYTTKNNPEESFGVLTNSVKK